MASDSCTNEIIKCCDISFKVTGTVICKVKDVNDNVPQFTNLPTVISIVEVSFSNYCLV